MQILIVDDNDVALEALRHTLQGEGYEITVAHNGREALDIVSSGACHLVISDWMMPEIDGLELCRQIRRMDLPGYVYFILLTSKDSADSVVEGLSAGADDFIQKPFDPAELLVRVRAGERILSLETRDVAIFAMAKLAESRDPETGEHLERMRNYSRILARHLVTDGTAHEQVDAGFARLIYLTSPLHDIGKVGIPDTVLLKPGRLSDREFDIMKTHTTIGAETLDAAVNEYPGVAYLRFARDIALTHHERFDGSGYPCGLAGFDIPLSGRVVALADVYDALTSKRVYKPAFAHDVARSMILEESGKHFDPEIVEAFRLNEEGFLEIRACSSKPELVVAS
jgi:cyclic di-GMP phosphodiesterase